MKAVAAGTAIYIAGTILMFLVLVMIMVMVSIQGDFSPRAIKQAADAFPDRWVGTAGLISERIVMLSAAFIAARMAGRNDYRTGSILAIIGAALSAAEVLYAPDEYSLTKIVLMLITLSAAALLGSRLAFDKAPSA